jgi:hypothetical protein
MMRAPCPALPRCHGAPPQSRAGSECCCCCCCFHPAATAGRINMAAGWAGAELEGALREAQRRGAAATREAVAEAGARWEHDTPRLVVVQVSEMAS